MAYTNQYCTSTLVQEEFKDLTFGTGTVISAARVDRMCIEESAKIDGKIGLVYTTPVSATVSPISAMMLQKICIALMYKRLRPQLEVKAPQATDSQQGSGPKEYDPEKDLQDISESKLLLPDAVLKRSSNGVDSFTSTNGITNTFQSGVKQW